MQVYFILSKAMEVETCSIQNITSQKDRSKAHVKFALIYIIRVYSWGLFSIQLLRTCTGGNSLWYQLRLRLCFDILECPRQGVLKINAIFADAL